MIIDHSVIDMFRKLYPLSVARDIVGVQPMGPVDLEALDQHPFWRPFCSIPEEIEETDER